ncbi:MAG TPA: CDP-alcohol phosphatidyltransferase family protein [Thermoflexia bacterium]|jgi:CDP-diacylglycerol--glycerol-3-phosphate 3-phosphatidyltransferase|nr:CDP-alcohol phosphatidyltransferase family protein [Thermoflexia bacterium]
MEEVQVGKARIEKVKKRSEYESFTDWARDAAQVITVPVAHFLLHLGIHPNQLTLLGSVLNLLVGAVLAMGHLTLGGWLLAIVAPIDAFDGAMARLTGQRSPLGAFLDSTMDRISEAGLLIGLATHYLYQGRMTEVLLAFVALAGANLVSYTRARAEGLGYTCKIGLLTRLERATILTVGLILGWPTLALWVLAVGSVLTALQRILHVYRLSQQ